MPGLAAKLAGLLAKLKGIPVLGTVLGWLGIGAGKVSTGVATVAGIYAVVIVGLHLLTSLLIAIAGALIPLAITFNNNIISAGFVEEGQRIVLGVANMAFIVALVVIAFATMLRSEAFGYKKALPRLIVAALLINFSFFIVSSFFINPVNTITNSIWQATGFVGTFSESAEAIFDPRGAAINALDIDIPKDDEFNFPGIPDAIVTGIGKLLAGSILGIAFAFISVLALLAFAVMLFIRGLALAFLIILMPIAWAGLVFPNLKIPGGGNPWKEWWENFIRWLLFAPFSVFFFFLAIKVANSGASDLVPGSSSDLATGIGQMFAVIGLMIGGLIVANKMGITGSGYALAAASKGRVWGEVQLKKYGHRGRRTILGSKPMVKGTRKLKDVGKGWTPTLFGRRIDLSGAAAPIRGAGRGVSRVLEKSEEALFEEASKREMERHPPEAFGEEGIAGLHVDAQAARIARASENGTIWEIKDLEEVLAYEWKKIRARLPTKVRLKVEGQLDSPLAAYEHLKPVYEAKKKESFKDEEWNEYRSLQKREGETQEAAEKATGFKKVDLTTELARIRTQREAMESSSTVEIGKRGRSGFQQSVQAWMPTKSRSGLVAAEPELMEKRYQDGEFKPFYGRTEATTDIVRDAIQDARMEIRPDLLTSWNTKMFPDGLVFANAKREEKIRETNDLLRRLLRLERDEANISERKREDIAPAIIEKWPDKARWSALIAEIRRTSPQEAPKYETIMSQGAETFATRFLALLSRRRQLAQATYELAGTLG